MITIPSAIASLLRSHIGVEDAMRVIPLICVIAMTALSALPALGDQLQDAIEAWNRKDFRRAVQLVRPLAEAGNPSAQGLLGDMYNSGDGVAKDAKEAVKWWTRAAEKGEPVSQLNLGDSYAAGRGVQENFAEAVKWWRKAAEQNITRAQTGLGLALYQGRGVRQNKAEAAKWFAKAADKNDVQAQAMLSSMYFQGEGGLAQSVVEAYKWALIAGAAAEGILMPPKILIEGAMRAAQKNEAIHLAEQWKFDKGLTKTPPGPIPADDTGVYFVKLRQLAPKCSGTSASDLAWCDAYIAGVIDTLGANRKSLKEDAENARFCLRKKTVSLTQARQAVGKVIAMIQEDSNSPLLDAPAPNSVIAGVLTHLCE
jgi:Sel1 repeat